MARKQKPPEKRFNTQDLIEALDELAQKFAQEPDFYDPARFPAEFLKVFNFPARTLKNLDSDIEGAALLKGQIHLLCLSRPSPGEESSDFSTALRKLEAALKAGKLKGRDRPKLLMVTDGVRYAGENVRSGESFDGEMRNLAQDSSIGAFLPLIGVDYTPDIKDSIPDRKAAGRLRKLYVELMKANPDWAAPEKRHALNVFLTRLIFCLFADETGIFPKPDSGAERQTEGIFLQAIKLHGAQGRNDFANVRFAMQDFFTALGHRPGDRARLPKWAQTEKIPYVNGHLFEDAAEIPEFSPMGWHYFLEAARAEWEDINPDIFGSLIQTIKADHEAAERRSDGIHYTSVSNIKKLLNPLFLDELREDLEQAGENRSRLRTLLERIRRIRVFDPACGSGNFLVIAYKELRALEAEILKKLSQSESSAIPLENFRGIELEDFPAQIARLALVVAKFQCDTRYEGADLACKQAVPLDKQNWIVQGNALRLDWQTICPAKDKKTARREAFPAEASERLFLSAGDQPDLPVAEMVDFECEGGELYIVGNPPYRGSTYQTADQKADMKAVFESRIKKSGIQKYASLDFVCPWFFKASRVISQNRTEQNRTEQNRTEQNRSH